MPTTKITGSEMASCVQVGTIYAVTEGIVTNQTVLAAWSHPKMRILRVWIIAAIIGAASNGSVLKNATTICTAAALNVAAVFNVTQLAVLSGTDVLEESERLNITTSGATDKFLWLFEYELCE
jgi:hypothetical protein